VTEIIAMNFIPEDIVHAPDPTWEDYLDLHQDEDGPPLPDDDDFLADWTRTPIAIEAPIETDHFGTKETGEKHNEASNALTLYDPAKNPKADDPSDDVNDTIATTLKKLAQKLGSSSLDKYVQEDAPDEVAADMSKKLSNLSLNNNSDNDLVDVEFTALMEYSTTLMMSTCNQKTKKVYERYQAMYSAYLKLYRLDPKIPESVQTFMVVLHHKYSGSTLWTFYSCLNSWYKAKLGLNLKQWPILTGLMKTITANHVIKKAPTFTSTDMEGIFKSLRADSEHETFEGRKSLLRLVGTSLAYYGLCRSADLMNIVDSDVRKHDSRGNYFVLFEPSSEGADATRGAGNIATKKRKHTMNAFSFNLPLWLTPYIDTYKSQSAKNSSRFLKNPQKRVKAGGKVFVQNVRKNNFANWGKDFALTLHKTVPDTYTSHCWRRSGATNLANNGGTELQLKRAGQWSSIKSACGYTEDSEFARKQQLELLETGVNDSPTAQVDIKNNTGSNVSVDTSTNRLSNSQAINGVGTICGASSNVVVNNHFYCSPLSMNTN
jgi:hypothetical protein